LYHTITDDDILEIKKELGDVVWYIAMMAHSLELSLDDVMQLKTL